MTDNPAPTYREMRDDPEHAREVNARWDSMQGWASSPTAKCGYCGGRGRLKIDGFDNACEFCSGTGRAKS